jgi:SAM-dependent methyltransferase
MHCAICKEKEEQTPLYPATFSIDKINTKTFSARRSPDRMHYQFVRCKRCGLIFSNPIFSTEKIEHLYKKSTFDYPTESVYLKKTYGDLLEKILTKRNNTVKLLDIGCGNGFFLEEAKDRGVSDIYGVEPGKESVHKALPDVQKRITVDIFKKGLFKKNFFDVITCFHTLDHIIDPNTFLQTVHESLRKNGKIIFVVHNTEGLSVKLFGEKSPIFDIEHIYLFNKITLRKLFQQNGFKKISVVDLTNTYALSYWLRMIPLPLIIKSPMQKFLNKTRLDTIPLSLRVGNIAIFAEK